MQIYDVIASAQSGRAIDNLAAAAGISPAQADAVLRTVIPELVKGLERNTLSRGGLADLVKALGDGHHEEILESPASLLRDPSVRADGDAILGHILGSKDRSRAVALGAARASGLGDELIRMLLPYLAQLLMGAIAKWAKGGLGDVIGKLPGGGGGGQGLPFPMPGGGAREEGRGGTMESGNGGFGLPRSQMPDGGFPMPPMPGGSGHTQDLPMPSGDGGRRSGGFGLPDAGRPEGGYPMPPMPDAGSGQGAGQASGFPLPLPLPQSGGSNPYGDLSDILRRGGTSVGGAPAGGLVRNILGSLLGFQSKGVISWIIRLIVVRFGWGLVKRLLGRVLLGGR